MARPQLFLDRPEPGRDSDCHGREHEALTVSAALGIPSQMFEAHELATGTRTGAVSREPFAMALDAYAKPIKSRMNQVYPERSLPLIDTKSFSEFHRARSLSLCSVGFLGNCGFRERFGDVSKSMKPAPTETSCVRCRGNRVIVQECGF